MQHETVLLNEAVNELCCNAGGRYVDGTFGRGGHSRLVLKRLNDSGKLYGVDKDPQAIKEGSLLADQDKRFSIIHSSFATIGDFLEPGTVDGVLLDLGVSSPQINDASRGFSFLQDGPLDMRMNPDHGQTAAEWLMSEKEENIARVLWEYGEERFSRRMAKAIVKERQLSPIGTTGHLARVIKEANPRWEKHKHPATRAFQAIRIFINHELEDLKKVLNVSIDLLKPDGRLVVISFHSLEDRIVKQFIRNQARGDYANIPRWVPITEQQANRRLRSIGKPVRPTENEINNNPRSRSAIMRVAEKCSSQA